jgi:hypothetical protein
MVLILIYFCHAIKSYFVSINIEICVLYGKHKIILQNLNYILIKYIILQNYMKILHCALRMLLTLKI